MDYHVPVMLDECVNALNVQKDKLYFDGTLGGGGHSREILGRGGYVIATDLDQDAISFCKQTLTKEYYGRFTLINDNFKNIKEILRSHDIDALDGAILDLGVSSHQLDTAERGFSYRYDDSLDMRMNKNQQKTAFSVVNEYSEKELATIFFTYSEERYAKRIAANIVKERTREPIKTTGKLSEIVAKSVPYNFKEGHPAKRVFQALRIEVNGELNGLSEGISDVIDCLKPNARLCVISFHSLEDRIVKQVYKLRSTGCICDKSLPVCVCNHKADIRQIGRIKPSTKELQKNPRSKSATLRIIEKM